MKRRGVVRGGMAAFSVGALARPAIAQADRRTLKWVPQAGLANLDPVWTTAFITYDHGCLVWDTLYALDSTLTARPQMCEAGEASADGLTWRFRLREGLRFHDGEPVRGIDCIVSIQRWAKRNGFGQRLLAQTAEMKATGDGNFEIRLTRPFPRLTYALASQFCFIMPERISRTDPFTPIKEYIGSGPCRFIEKEWVPATHAAYERFADYRPRDEKPDFFAGGKVMHFDRVEWVILPDPATAAAALQTGEVDWVSNPLIDLLGVLEARSNIRVEVFDKLGVLPFLCINHLYPPFNNPALCRALLPAIDQREFLYAASSGREDLFKADVGVFTPGSPLASIAGLDVLTGPRDVALARRLVKEAGYAGEPIVLMSPTDQLALQNLAQVARALFESVGLKVDYLSTDWASVIQRRTNKSPPDKGGWNCFPTSWPGLFAADPGNYPPLRGNGMDAYVGWPTDPKMEALREDWFDVQDVAGQRRIGEQMQTLAMQNVPFYPLGQRLQPTGYRTDLTDFVHAGNPSAFWSVRRI